MTLPDNVFVPDYAVPPGATLLELLDLRGISQAELALRTGRPKKTINEIIRGKAAITPETALQLERVLGPEVSAGYWTRLEANYRATLARIAERERLESSIQWARSFPVAAMRKLRWIPDTGDKVKLVEQLLSFFGVASPEAWEDVWRDVRPGVAFRQSKAFEIDFGAVAAWLRQGEIAGRQMDCEPFDRDKFREVLAYMRTLTTADPIFFSEEMTAHCALAGVAVALVRELPKTRAFGAARWLSPDKAFIQLSLYRKFEDQFWFSFFHEAGHILLHGKRDIFVDVGTSPNDRDEDEANRFASDLLIPPAAYDTFSQEGEFTNVAIEAFAKEQGITPGIVVGRLQHDAFIQYNKGNSLRRRFVWAENE
jgi:addiction module HigA family antidote